MTHLRSPAPPPSTDTVIADLSGTDEEDDDVDDDEDDEEDDVDDKKTSDEEEPAKLSGRRVHSKSKRKYNSSDDLASNGDSSSLKSNATPEAGKVAPAPSSPMLSKKKKPLQHQQSVRKRTQKCDIFSAGLVYFYVLVPGEHPYGQWFEREANIMTGKSDLSRLEDMPDAADLVRRMLASDPDLRPTAAQVCRHPFFWSAQRRLEFLVDLSDRLEHEAVTAAPVLALESSAATVVGRGGWDRNLDPGLLLDMNKYRKYDSHCVRDLLRVVRNKRLVTRAFSYSSSLIVLPSYVTEW